jgi:uncharacterized protein (TIGR02117 family)
MAIKYLKITGIILLRVLEFLLGFILCYWIIFSIGLLIPCNTDYEYNKEEVQFYVMSNGVHTDVCLPVVTNQMDWRTKFDTQSFGNVSAQPKFVSIGWGDKGFYLDTPTWAEVKASTVVKAAFLPSATAMHVIYNESKPQESDKVFLCSMSTEEYTSLIKFIIHESFSSPIKPGVFHLLKDKSYGNRDNFYEAQGNYHLLRTCNTWTNRALKIAGVRTSRLALFEDGILRWL